MATIEFRGKVEQRWGMDNIPYAAIKVPKLERRHCDMNAFRRHPKFGGLANSDLFPSVLQRIAKDVGGVNGYVRLDKLADNVRVDSSGFLARVTIEV